MPDTHLLSIGEVINQLRDDFPDVSVSKIRFLESQGLIDPKRSASGYRLFAADDMARLRFILQQQRDHFLPLKVIKSKLTLWERGEDLSEDVDTGFPQLVSVGEPLDRPGLMKRSGLNEKDLGELIDVGLVRPMEGSNVFPAEAGVVASEAKRLMDLGLEPRHLRAVRLGSEREADLLAQLAAPLIRASNNESKARAREILETASESIAMMHRSMLSIELKAHLET